VSLRPSYLTRRCGRHGAAHDVTGGETGHAAVRPACCCRTDRAGARQCDQRRRRQLRFPGGRAQHLPARGAAPGGLVFPSQTAPALQRPALSRSQGSTGTASHIKPSRTPSRAPDELRHALRYGPKPGWPADDKTPTATAQVGGLPSSTTSKNSITPAACTSQNAGEGPTARRFVICGWQRHG